MTQITEIELVDSYHTLNISGLYARKPDRFDKGILLVFANFGLKIVGFGSEAYKTIKKRYKRVLDQIKDNKKNSKAESRIRTHAHRKDLKATFRSTNWAISSSYTNHWQNQIQF